MLPELAYWFHVDADSLADRPMAELVEFLNRLPTLPPIGETRVIWTVKGD